jgi:hypothetical protein
LKQDATKQLESLLREAATRGVLSAEQADRLRALDRELAGSRGEEVEARSGFNWVNVAYLLGALLVLYAFGWFLVRRWAALGAWGVLGVVAVYATMFLATGRWLDRRGFSRAATVAVVLCVGLTPLLAWAILSLSGEWPALSAVELGPAYATYMGSRWLILSLATILLGLVAIRQRRDPLLTLPIAVATWWSLFSLDQTMEVARESLAYQRWIMIAYSLVVVGIAEVIERWQRRESAASGQPLGDFAGAFWLVGLSGFAVAYTALWLRLEGWRHFLAAVAAGVVVLSIVLKRRIVFAFGLLGTVGYLAFLAEDVFKTGVAFPLVLAAIGVATIAVTVWLQKRYPSLLKGPTAEARSRPLPWSPAMAWLPAFFAAAMALLALSDVAEERAQRDFQARLHILRGHSGSRPRAPRAPAQPPGPSRSGEQIQAPDSAPPPTAKP